VIQLKDGTLLAGTQEGLALFDGTRLGPPLWGNLAKVGPVWVNRLLEDPDGTVWIATRDHGLIRVTAGGVTHFGKADGLGGGSIESVYRDAAGRLWIGTSDAGLFRLEGRQVAAIPLGGSPGSEFIQVISSDAGGRMLVGTRGGLFVGAPGNWRRFGHSDGLASDHIYALTRAAHDAILIGTENGGLAVLSEGAVRPVSGWPKSTPSVVAIRQDSYGTWVGTNGGGLFRLQNGKVEALTTANGLPSNLVWALAGDNEGGLWVGTNGGGLARLDAPPVSVFGVAEGLSSDVVLATLQARDGTLWVGTAGGGLNAIKDGVVRHFTTTDGLATNIVTALHEDPSGALWVGTGPTGLHLLRQGRVTRVEIGAAFPGAGINSIRVDRRGRLWVGSNGAGLGVREGTRWRFFRAPESLPSNFVQAMEMDAAGTLYIGTRGGVVAVDGDRLVRQPVFADPQKNSIMALHASPSGSLWLGSHGGGISRLRAGRLVHIGGGGGLPSGTVNGILEDSRGTLWLTTNTGISSFSRVELEEVADGKHVRVSSYSIGKSEGMRSRETNGGVDPPGWVGKDGNIRIPTMSGVVSVESDRLARAPRPRVTVSGVIAEGVRLRPEPDLALSAATTRVSIPFRVLTFAPAGALVVQYRLDGVDADWVDAGANRHAEYTSIPTGPLTFEVRARHRQGVWGPAGRITFRRDPRWYERLIVYLLAVLTLAGLLLAAHRLRLRYWKQEVGRFRRSAAEKELVLATVRERESRFSALLEHASDAIFLLDGGGRISYVSPSMERLTGRGSDALIGNLLLDLIHPDDRASVESAFESIAHRPKAPTPFRYRLELPGNVWRSFSAIGRNLLDEPVVGGVIVNARDVTEQEEAENLFRQAQKIDAIGKLAGGIAHDFNNILTVITNYAEFVVKVTPPDDPRLADLSQIRKGADRAVALTQQLLAFSRRQVMNIETIDPNAAILSAERLLERLIGEDVQVVTRLDPSVSSVKFDRSQLEQVVFNLVINARDAMPKGGTLTIDTANVVLENGLHASSVGVAGGRFVKLTVTDTGVGMDEETQRHAFDPFFTTKASGSGTGLGLSTVYGIVTQSGGSVTVQSRLGAGTSFSVYLPAAETSDIAVESASEIAEPAKGTETILLVEDEPEVRSVVERMLQQNGYTVIASENGGAALELSRGPGFDIDLLLTDMVMPGISGREVAQAILSTHPDVAVLIMSGYNDETVERQGSPLPGASFIGKPFTMVQLMSQVRDILDARRPALRTGDRK